MSETAVINVRTDSKIKKQAQAVAEKLGLNLSVVVNAYLRQLVRTKSVAFSLSEEPTDYLLEILKESKKEIKRDLVSPAFGGSKEAVRWLNNSKRRYGS
jgi:addiction module RelB/DinJ family antitoxin